MAIDHERRRRDIAEITIDLVAREGVRAATIRRIAAEAGCSTTAVTHYFADKEELLLWAFEVLSREGDLRFAAAVAEAPGDPVPALLTMVPWCETNRKRWRAYLAYWDEAARNPWLAAMLAQGTRSGLAQLRQLLEARTGRVAGLDKAVRLLNAMIQGLALQMLVDESGWPPGSAAENLAEAFGLATVVAHGHHPGRLPSPAAG